MRLLKAIFCDYLNLVTAGYYQKVVAHLCHIPEQLFQRLRGIDFVL
jgi:hypothetical protein